MSTLFLLVIAAAYAQTAPAPGVPPLTRIRDYLSLTDAQVESLIANLRQESALRAERARRVTQLQQALQEEAARQRADPGTLGSLAVERETVCRSDRQQQTAVTERAVALLTAAQRTRLQTLDEARKLDLVMVEAQSLALLDSGPLPSSLSVPQPLPGCASSYFGALPGNFVYFSNGPSYPLPTFAAKQYLNLTDAQYRVLSDNALRYANAQSGVQTSSNELYGRIAAQTAREQLDPAALGALYAELASLCQAELTYYRELRRSAESILDDTQKRRLAIVQSAQSLAPVIGEA